VTLSPEELTGRFFDELRREVVGGNRDLDQAEQGSLRGHYPVINNPAKFPTELVKSVYVARRSMAVSVIMDNPGGLVLDAGCGYGSDSILFAAAGARVVAVDRSASQLAIAEKRRRHFGEVFGTPLEVQWEISDLDDFVPGMEDLALTWVASVLAALTDQGRFISRIYGSSREGASFIVTDMNLLNPLFLAGEWRRRRRARQRSPLFAEQSHFGDMLRRKNRVGARYFPSTDGNCFDDVQFFTPVTIGRLLAESGFEVIETRFSGFAPPVLSGCMGALLEGFVASVPLIRRFGYFYSAHGVKGSLSGEKGS
jgi:SAM-dependent methyltransferase